MGRRLPTDRRLRAEYEVSAVHANVPTVERALCSKLLAVAVEIGVFWFCRSWLKPRLFWIRSRHVHVGGAGRLDWTP